MIRTVVAVACGAAVLATGMSGCSTKKASESPTTSGTATATSTAAATGANASAGPGTARVTIDGKPKEMQGQVLCSTAGGNLNIAIGEQGTGVAVVMAEDASKVTSVGLGNVDGVVLGFQDMAPGASASATRDGKAYKVTGTATGVDMANPMQPITKPFEIEVTCP